jgi:hypothetical protein
MSSGPRPVGERGPIAAGVISNNLGCLLRRLALPLPIESRLLTSPQQRLLKTGACLIRRARYFILQLAERHLTESPFRRILPKIQRLAWHSP